MPIERKIDETIDPEMRYRYHVVTTGGELLAEHVTVIGASKKSKMTIYLIEHNLVRLHYRKVRRQDIVVLLSSGSLLSDIVDREIYSYNWRDQMRKKYLENRIQEGKIILGIDEK